MTARFFTLALCAVSAWGQAFQSSSPFYPARNPFYFEGKVDFDKLNIVTPNGPWEYLQRAIHLQDDLGDKAGAVADYKRSIELNSVGNGTCQIVRTANPSRDPAPCMFTNRLRLAVLLREEAPTESVALFQEVLEIDPLRLGVNELMAEVYEQIAHRSGNPVTAQEALASAIGAYQSELALSPVTKETIALTGDQANNAHVHWALAQLYEEQRDPERQAAELDLYLQATRRHSDVYPWRMAIASRKLASLQAAH